MTKWLAVLATAILAVGLVGYATKASGSGANAKAGGTFRMGTSSRIDSLNPYVAFNQDAYNTFEYVYPFLVQYDKTNSKFVSDFATSWKPTDGGKTWTFKTRSGAKWTDGQPLTAKDAAWTITTDLKYAAGGAANAAGLVAHIKSAKAPNANTLVVRYSKAPGNVLGQFQQLAILPQHIWSQHTGNKGTNLKTFSNNPLVGAGPFKLVKFKKDDIALFQRNGSFYGEKPKADAFGLQMFSNEDALVAALKAHQIDAIEAVPGTAIKTLRNAGFNVRSTPGVDQTDFIINSNAKKSGHRELLNLKVKAAMAHAIDRKQIVRVVFLGYARPASSIVPAATGAWANPAGMADQLASSQVLPVPDRERREVRVAGFPPVGVFHGDRVPVPADFIDGAVPHEPRIGAENRGAHRRGVVDAEVLAGPERLRHGDGGREGR